MTPRGDRLPQEAGGGDDTVQPAGDPPVPDAADYRWLALFAVAGLLALVVWRLWRQRRPRAAEESAAYTYGGPADVPIAEGSAATRAAAGEALRRLDEPSDERTAVIAAWAVFEERMEAVRPRLPHDTAGVIATRALEIGRVRASSAPVVLELLGLFERARFAPTSPLTATDVQRARVLLTRLTQNEAAD